MLDFDEPEEIPKLLSHNPCNIGEWILLYIASIYPKIEILARKGRRSEIQRFGTRREGGGLPPGVTNFYSMPVEAPSPLVYFTMLPGAISMMGQITERLPSSLLAARIIPWDSCPMSFAGWRFATTISDLFTRSCGW